MLTGVYRRQNCQTKSRSVIRCRQKSVFFRKPYRFTGDDEGDHRNIRSAGDFEGRTSEAVQFSLRRARALREDKHPKTFANPRNSREHHVIGVARAARPLEQACPLQERPEPAAAVEGGLDRGGHVLEGRHGAGHVAQAGVIGDQDGRSLGQRSLDFSRVKVQQPAEAQRVVHQGESPPHDALKAPRAPRRVFRAEELP